MTERKTSNRASSPKPGRLAAAIAALALMVSACGTETATEEPSVAALDADSETSSGQDTTGPDGNQDSDPPTDTEIEQAELQFQQCLEDNGISTGGAPGEAGGEVVAGSDDSGSQAMVQEFEVGDDFEAAEAAFAECDRFLEDVYGAYTPSPEEEAAFQHAEAAFETCMSNNGIEIDTSGAEGAAISFKVEPGDDGEFEQVMDVCSKEAFADLDGEFSDSTEDADS